MSTILPRIRLLAVALCGLSVVLLYLTTSRLGGRMPVLPQLSSLHPTRTELVPAGRIYTAFQTNLWTLVQPDPGLTNWFHTKHFEPPPPPVVPPPPPRKVNLLYQGYFETAATIRHAYLRIDTNLAVLKVGSPVVADIAVAAIGFQTLTLTNAAGQTNVVQFRVPHTIEIPAQ